MPEGWCHHARSICCFLTQRRDGVEVSDVISLNKKKIVVDFVETVR